MTEPFGLMDVVVHQEGTMYRYRCAHSLDWQRWSVICADNFGGTYSVQLREQQERNFSELLEEMHPFDRMRPHTTLEAALAGFGEDEEERR